MFLCLFCLIFGIFVTLPYKMYKNIFIYFFSQASERAGILNRRNSLANHALVAGPAFYDEAHGPDFFPAQRCT